MNHRQVAYIMLAPAFGFFLLFSCLPLGLVCYLSFFKTNYIATTFIGLGNFAKAIADPAFRQAIVNTLIYAATIMIPVVTFSVFISLFVFNMPRWVHNYTRFVFYAPMFSAGVIISTVWRWIFHPRAGLANYLLSLFGAGPISWFGNGLRAIGCVSLTIIVATLGVQIMILLAAMLAIDRSIFDQARIDGAGWIAIKLRIILPIVAPVIALLSLVQLIGSMQIWEAILLLTNGGPAGGSASMMFDVYKTGFIYGEYGLASAKSLVMLVVILALAMIKRRIER